jgi:hypothetical protein
MDDDIPNIARSTNDPHTWDLEGVVVSQCEAVHTGVAEPRDADRGVTTTIGLELAASRRVVAVARSTP